MFLFYNFISNLYYYYLLVSFFKILCTFIYIGCEKSGEKEIDVYGTDK